MTRVYLSNERPADRLVLRPLLLDLKMEVVGEASDWFTTLVHVPISRADMLLVDWDLIPSNATDVALNGLRESCPELLIVVLINSLDAHTQVALSAGVDAFINKNETPEYMAEHLRAATASIGIPIFAG